MTTPQPTPQDAPFPQTSHTQTPPTQTYTGVNTPPPFPNTPTPPRSVPASALGASLAGYGSPRPSADDRTWAILAHLSAVVGAVVSVGWLTFLGPLIIYLIKKDSSPFVRNAAAGSFNFTLSMTLLAIAGGLVSLTVVGLVVGIPMMIVGALFPIVLGIVGAVKASNGESYTYPFQLKVLH